MRPLSEKFSYLTYEKQNYEQFRTSITRIRLEAVNEAAKRAKTRWPNQQVFLISDLDFSSSELDPAIEVFKKAITRETANGQVFVCAFNSDQRATPILKAIKDCGGQFMTPIQYEPVATYLHKDDLALEAISQDYDRAIQENLSHFSYRDFTNLLQALSITKDIPGDILEIGVFKGTSSRTMLNYLSKTKSKKKVYLMDTYEGFTFDAAKKSADAQWLNTHTEAPLETVQQRLQEYQLQVDFHFVKGDICKGELPREMSQLSLVNLDVDMYEAVLVGLRKVAPLLAKNGIIIAEDPGHTPGLGGAQLALDEFLQEPSGKSFIPVYLESGQYFLIKTQ